LLHLLRSLQAIELHSAPASAALHDSELGGISQPACQSVILAAPWFGSADWPEHGASVLSEVREKSPAIYLRVIASLVPRHLAIETIGDEFDEMTTTELRQYLAEQARELGLLDDLPENRDGH
jgi:hypothetical protein